MTHDPVRVFIVDDHELLRRGLREALEPEKDITVVGESGRFEDTAEQIVELGADVAVIDVRLGDGSGVDLCRQLQARGAPTRCLIFTSSTGEEPLYQSILAGASGYLLKTASGKDIVSAIRTLAEGRSLIDPAVMDQVLARIRRQEGTRLGKLTIQEREVLRLIGEGLTNAEISARLRLADQTVKNYVSRVLIKLDLSRTQAALFAAAKRRSEEASE